VGGDFPHTLVFAYIGFFSPVSIRSVDIFTTLRGPLRLGEKFAGVASPPFSIIRPNFKLGPPHLFPLLKFCAKWFSIAPSSLDFLAICRSRNSHIRLRRESFSPRDNCSDFYRILSLSLVSRLPTKPLGQKHESPTPPLPPQVQLYSFLSL